MKITFSAIFACTALALNVKSFAQNTYPWPSTGHIGIGTASPNSTLQVVGTENISGNATFGSNILQTTGTATMNNVRSNGYISSGNYIWTPNNISIGGTTPATPTGIGNLVATGNISCGGSLSIAGTTTLTGDVTFGGNITQTTGTLTAGLLTSSWIYDPGIMSGNVFIRQET